MQHILYFLRPNRQMSVLQMIGIILLLVGICCIIGVGVSTLASPPPITPDHNIIGSTSTGIVGSKPAQTIIGNVVPPTKDATIMALAFLLITISWPLIFPNMLRSSAKGEISSTRTVVFMLVAAFITLSVRVGWTDPSMEGLILGSGWVGILAVAFGAKTAQYYAENWPFSRNASAMPLTSSVPLVNTTFGSNPGAPSGPNPPPPGAFAAVSRAMPISSDFIESNAGDLPVHFHEGISKTPPQSAPPAVQRALKTTKS
jgi:hypothetical protein